jgi:tetratricopeptide (TPR) repeat protein
MRFIKLLIPVLFLIYANTPANDYETYLKKGDEYFDKFDNIRAIKNYEEAYRLAPNDYEVLLKLTRTYNDAGEEYKELRKRDEAEKYINKAVKLVEIFHKKFPDSAEVYSYLAMSYGNLAMYVGGNEKIKLAHKIKDNALKAIKMNSDLYMPHVILGIYNRQIADLSWLERAFANTFFGDVPEGSFEESVKMLKKALEIEPNTIIASFQLALTYGKMGQEEKQKEILKKMLSYKDRNFRDKYARQKAKRILEKMS